MDSTKPLASPTACYGLNAIAGRVVLVHSGNRPYRPCIVFVHWWRVYVNSEQGGVVVLEGIRVDKEKPARCGPMVGYSSMLMSLANCATIS